MKTVLRQIREDMGYKQVEIAKKANISLRAYQRYESGERIPDAHVVQLIARALKTTVSEIFPIPHLLEQVSE